MKIILKSPGILVKSPDSLIKSPDNLIKSPGYYFLCSIIKNTKNLSGLFNKTYKIYKKLLKRPGNISTIFEIDIHKLNIVKSPGCYQGFI